MTAQAKRIKNKHQNVSFLWDIVFFIALFLEMIKINSWELNSIFLLFRSYRLYHVVLYLA